MSNILKFDKDIAVNVEKNNEMVEVNSDLIELSEDLLLDLRGEISGKETISVPIAEIALLGAGVSALLPALRTVTQETTFNVNGLYRLVNAGAGDALKVAKNGDLWGAMKTASGASKMARFQEVGATTSTSATVLPVDPVTMMIAATLFVIEQQIKGIEKMQKQIFSFLENDKESKIEADVDVLCKIIKTYKHNWDNEHFVASNHKMVLDIQRMARGNMLSYKKEVAEILDSKKLLIAQSKVHSTLNDLQKKFKYYRMSLYAFSMASFVEIILGGNFKEANILETKNEIEQISLEYREIFTRCSVYLEKMMSLSVEANVLKGIGTASNAVGKLIGSIPLVKEGQVDEFLQDSGLHLKENVQEMGNNILEEFAKLHNPGNRVFMEKMDDLIKIYNHTSQIYFDNEKIYLFAS